MENNKFKDNAERMQYLNDKQDEIAKMQEDELVLDYDEALKEEASKTLKIKMNGKVYEAPGKMPFSFSTLLIRKCFKKVNGKQLFSFDDYSTMTEIIEKIFGKKFMHEVDKSVNKNISLEWLFRTVIPDIMGKWGMPIDTKDSNIQKKIMTQG